MENRNIPNLHQISTSKNTLNGPFGKFAAVVLHLGSHDSTPLRIKLGPPIRSATCTLRSWVEFVQSTNGRETLAFARITTTGNIRINFCADANLEIVVLSDSQIK